MEADVTEEQAACIAALIREEEGEKEEPVDEEGLNDEWADDVEEDKKKKPEEAASSSAAPVAGMEQRVSILEGKTRAQGEILQEVSLEGFKNILRIMAKGRQKPRAFYEAGADFIKRCLEDKNVSQIKRSAFYFDIHMRYFGNPKSEAEEIKKKLDETKFAEKAYQSPPPNPQANPLKCITLGIYRAVMEAYDEVAQKQHMGQQRIRIMRRHAESVPPQFSIEYGCRVLCKGLFLESCMKCEVSIMEDFNINGTRIMASGVISICPRELKSACKRKVMIKKKGTITLEKAPNFRELVERGGLKSFQR